ncbi:MAG: 1-acyl-sn-glycerol-3-phosphate acyltransferase [Verrucomicrobia bacterium]|nr:1-acyl-sn-glycerol-3-phosphate acyltransferase [Cytophagales bacterium]
MLFMVLFFPLAAGAYVLGTKIGGQVSCFMLRSWAFLFSFFIGIVYKTPSKKKVHPHTPAVFVANHRSFLDTPAAYLSIPTVFKPLGKIEMQKAPFFGWFYPKVVIIVDRSSAASHRKSMAEMKKCLENGISIFIFPEGTTNKSEETLTKFHDGAFRLAIEAQVPLIPLVIRNTANLLPPNKANVYPGLVTTQLLEPIPTLGLEKSDVAMLKEKVYRQMENKLEEAYEPNPVFSFSSF